MKNELEAIYKKRVRRKLHRIQRNQIENNMYNINVLQQQRKFENESKIKVLKIQDTIYEGTVEVVRGIQN